MRHPAAPVPSRHSVTAFSVSRRRAPLDHPRAPFSIALACHSRHASSDPPRTPSPSFARAVWPSPLPPRLLRPPRTPHHPHPHPHPHRRALSDASRTPPSPSLRLSGPRHCHGAPSDRPKTPSDPSPSFARAVWPLPLPPRLPRITQDPLGPPISLSLSPLPLPHRRALLEASRRPLSPLARAVWPSPLPPRLLGPLGPPITLTLTLTVAPSQTPLGRLRLPRPGCLALATATAPPRTAPKTPSDPSPSFARAVWPSPLPPRLLGPPQDPLGPLPLPLPPPPPSPSPSRPLGPPPFLRPGCRLALPLPRRHLGTPQDPLGPLLPLPFPHRRAPSDPPIPSPRLSPGPATATAPPRNASGPPRTPPPSPSPSPSRRLGPPHSFARGVVWPCHCHGAASDRLRTASDHPRTTPGTLLGPSLPLTQAVWPRRRRRVSSTPPGALLPPPLPLSWPAGLAAAAAPSRTTPGPSWDPPSPSRRPSGLAAAAASPQPPLGPSCPLPFPSLGRLASPPPPRLLGPPRGPPGTPSRPLLTTWPRHCRRASSDPPWGPPAPPLSIT
ncbi:hypothetical protein BJY52DRAFT_1200195 [Lactarius psammicola]|nr:hypothetical protein BJY52DRAFT_1200195 [Lactarius psammicola]